MAEPRQPGVDEFIKLLHSPGAKTTGIPLRNCDDCGRPSAVAWALNIPALEQHVGRTLGVAFFCNAHSAELDAKLAAKLAAANRTEQPI